MDINEAIKVIEDAEDSELGDFLKEWVSGTVFDTDWEGWNITQRRAIEAMLVDFATGLKALFNPNPMGS